MFTELAKYTVYRTPLLRRLMTPKYHYKISPGQLAALIELIDATRDAQASVIEIGVAQGDTSVFLLEHLKSTSQSRRIAFVDTFAGFTDDSIRYEVEQRGKTPVAYGAFRYGEAGRFRANLRSQGYDNFEIVKSDATKVDWSAFAPIGAVLLDIDLYKPTIEVLRGIWEHIAPGGGVVVDDCLPDTPWDGSLAAADEFAGEAGVDWVRVGNKGALFRKPRA